MVAVRSLAIVPAVAVNVAVVLPDPTVTEAGTVSAVALPERETTAPPAGAGAIRETVHVDEPPVPRDAGAQFKALRLGGAAAVTVPPTPLMGSEVPPAVTPNVFVTLIVVLANPDAIVTLTTAATPFCITVVLRPASKHT
jgi:hypothetical protein